jgi:hypothetical protein
MKNETSRISATAIIIKSIMPLDVELYDDVVYEMLNDGVEITEDSLIEYYEAALCEAIVRSATRCS